MFNLLFAIFLSTSALADEPHADIILINQQDQNITLKTAQSIIVGVKVPPAVRAHGKNVAYSQFAFQALTSVCNRNYIIQLFRQQHELCCLQKLNISIPFFCCRLINVVK
ncbi:Hypothetical_protein [Hexamita inflata]|uniref:Hypothetical_protein n=1 Tax=Hexamita inflata TaxID=28002 RepID=A0AA86R1X3_9EUKA|nr:Hypothetical protein HINF_LOCUS52342 [Hexamita inflata]